MKKSLSILMIAVVFGVAISGCASMWKQTDPLGLGKNENTGVVRLGGDFVQVKINGEAVTQKSPAAVILPAGKNEYEFVYLLKPAGRGLITKFRTIVGKVQLDIESGKTYTLTPAEATGSAVTSIFLGSFVPVGNFKYVLFEKGKNKVEFPALVFDKDFWDAYQYPMLPSQE